MDVILRCRHCSEEILLARGANVDIRSFACPKCGSGDFTLDVTGNVIIGGRAKPKFYDDKWPDEE